MSLEVRIYGKPGGGIDEQSHHLLPCLSERAEARPYTLYPLPRLTTIGLSKAYYLIDSTQQCVCHRTKVQ